MGAGTAPWDLPNAVLPPRNRPASQRACPATGSLERCIPTGVGALQHSDGVAVLQPSQGRFLPRLGPSSRAALFLLGWSGLTRSSSIGSRRKVTQPMPAATRLQ